MNCDDGAVTLAVKDAERMRIEHSHVPAPKYPLKMNASA